MDLFSSGLNLCFHDAIKILQDDTNDGIITIYSLSFWDLSNTKVKSKF